MRVATIVLMLFHAAVATVPGHADTDMVRHGKKILMLGVTGAGKSTFGNLLVSNDAFEVGSTLESCTTDITQASGFLFGERATNIFLTVSDTGGLGDTEGRDHKFADDVAAHVRSVGGVHGVVYVHNACEKRLSDQARSSIATMVATLTDESSKQDLAARLSIVMTQCTDPGTKSLYETRLPDKLCDKFEMCNIPLFWYDDFNNGLEQSAGHKLRSAARRVLEFVMWRSSWRTSFESWVLTLPAHPANVPSESEREKLKREHREALERNENELKRLRAQIEEAELQQKQIEPAGTKQKDLTEEILAMKEEMKRLESRSCFAPLSTVFDKKLGAVMMKELQIGSEVATVDGWATVVTMLHWHPNETVNALQVVHDQGEITISPEHMIFTLKHGTMEAVPAEALQVGSTLIQKVGAQGEQRASRVTAIEPTTMDGYYAPLTSSGTILVDGLAASCYAHDENYGLSHWSLNLLTAPLRSIPTWLLSYEPCEGDRHPYLGFPLKMMNYVFMYE